MADRQHPGFRTVDVRADPALIAVTSELPWPLDSGGHLRSYHVLSALAARFAVRLIAPRLAADTTSAEAVLALRRAGLDPHSIPVPPRSPAREARRILSSALRREPYVLFGRHRHRPVRIALEEMIASRPPALMYLDHLDSLVYASRGDSTPLIVDMHNVYSRLAARTAAETDSRLRRHYLAGQATLLERMERRAVSAAHTILAVSTEEARYFSDLGARRVVVVPNGVDCAAYEAVSKARRAGPPTILYVGSLTWPPNASAARFLAHHVLPAVRQRLPGTRLAIVGKDPPDDLRVLASDSITVAANVPDVVPYYRDAHVLAVPLEAGGGTRLKILEAFAAGVPVVSTRVGCEGLEVESGCNIRVAEKSEFAAAVAEILSAPDRAEQMAARARALALAKYDWPIVGALAAEAVRSAIDGREPQDPRPCATASGRFATAASIGRL